MRWLDETVADELRRARQQRRAYASSQVRPLEPSLLDWPVLDAVLSREPAPDVLVVAQNQLLELPAPRSKQDVESLFEHGCGLVVRRAEDTHPRLRALAREVEREFSALAHIQLFVTPARSNSFGWHYDTDDVIIIQTLGQKEFYFRNNTVVSEPGSSAPDFGVIEHETSPLSSCRLHEGDMLYLPFGMWHVARAIEDSLHISLGLASATGTAARCM